LTYPPDLVIALDAQLLQPGVRLVPARAVVVLDPDDVAGPRRQLLASPAGAGRPAGEKPLHRPSRRGRDGVEALGGVAHAGLIAIEDRSRDPDLLGKVPLRQPRLPAREHDPPADLPPGGMLEPVGHAVRAG